jgi:hypothetical protein
MIIFLLAVLIVAIVSFGWLLYRLRPQEEKAPRALRFEDLSPEQKRYVLRRLKEKQRKEK